MNENQILDCLVENGNLTEVNRVSVLQEKKRSHRSVLELMSEWGLFSEDEIVAVLSEILDCPTIDLETINFDLEAWKSDLEFFITNELVPIEMDDDNITIALFNPADRMLIRSIEYGMKKQPQLCLATKKKILKFWENQLKDEDEPDEQDLDHIIDLASEGPVVRIVNDIISRAVELHASDIHLEAKGPDLKLRYRMDGMLHDFPAPPSGMGPAIISRIKILSNLDIAERRIPQDGALKFPTSMKEVDVRVSVIPTVYGESIVMRILDKGSIVLDFQRLGLDEKKQRLLMDMLSRSYGMIVVAGPTGTGKTTTLYTALSRILTENRKIVTIEDPVEYKMKNVTQIQVNPKAGLTFASGLRSILRHDPDVVLVGEIRDAETASISIQAALTGHLVLSTLHANHAAQVFSRFIDMGIEPFLVSAAVIGTVSQRLVRMLCQDCKEETKPDKTLAEKMNFDSHTVYKPKGCGKCNQTGFKGRTGIYEIMQINGRIQQMILNGASAPEIEAHALKSGFSTMLDDGLLKSQTGVTSVEEIFRVAG